MRINLEHVKAILLTFLDSEKMFVQLNDIKTSYPDENIHNFAFHYLLLIEQGFISSTSSELSSMKGCGYVGLVDGITPEFSNARVRLTASGHEFAATLESPSVFERMKDFSQEPLSVIKDIGRELAVGYLKQKCGITV